MTSAWSSMSGHNCLADAVALTAHARQAGASAIAADGSELFQAGDREGPDRVLRADRRGGRSACPSTIYHIPGMTNLRLPIAEFLHEARFRIPNLRGLKFSHSDLVELQECVHVDDGAFEVVFGQDEFLLAGLVLRRPRGRGVYIQFRRSALSTADPAFESGDLPAARAAQFQAARMVQVLCEFGFSSAAKAVMALIGVNCGPVRPPLRNLSPRRSTPSPRSSARSISSLVRSRRPD